MNINELKNKLKEVGYCSNEEIDYAVAIAMLTDRPLLIEGAPGVGKTSLAKAVADALGLEFIRVQMYDGLTDDKILYDYDYQKQLLTLEAIKPVLEKEYKDMKVNDIIHHVANKLDFYGKDFMIERPFLKAINGKGKKVILIDEIDKSPEEIEYMLYEFLEDYSITIPQYGTINCPEKEKPIVFITSNGYRNLSEAFRRRCNYLYLEQKTHDEMVEILLTRAKVSESVADGIALCLIKAAGLKLEHIPAISEGIAWAEFLNKNPNLSKEIVINSVGMLAKNKKDVELIKEIVENYGENIWKS